MSVINAKANRKKYAVLIREPRCFPGSLDFFEQRKFFELYEM